MKTPTGISRRHLPSILFSVTAGENNRRHRKICTCVTDLGGNGGIQVIYDVDSCCPLVAKLQTSTLLIPTKTNKSFNISHYLHFLPDLYQILAYFYGFISGNLGDDRLNHCI